MNYLLTAILNFTFNMTEDLLFTLSNFLSIQILSKKKDLFMKIKEELTILLYQ